MTCAEFSPVAPPPRVALLLEGVTRAVCLVLTEGSWPITDALERTFLGPPQALGCGGGGADSVFEVPRELPGTLQPEGKCPEFLFPLQIIPCSTVEGKDHT